jgi:non-ribosomal peptide synthetase component F
MHASWAFFTPSVAALLDPILVESLRKLTLAGEALNKKVVDQWKDHIALDGLYGPAEASICAWGPNVRASSTPTNIGTPLLSAFLGRQPRQSASVDANQMFW